MAFGLTKCKTKVIWNCLDTAIKNYRILFTKAGRAEAQAREEISAMAAEYGVSV